LVIIWSNKSFSKTEGIKESYIVFFADREVDVVVDEVVVDVVVDEVVVDVVV